ncbi:MAG: CoA ester lyase [Alphaproteobacteria bacterium]|nr:CoA ester lyase [Alphaproteobacteria bacterium]MBL6937506.1 CoA ester lyase [Alphaproteobacteria bacterium]MBL7098844.1 CoA ester lyase [Alphaproteobacteria bacterium]
MTTIRPRRSVLYMPGSNARALEKARTLPADALILDLEDAVAPDAKEIARQQVCDAVKARGFGKREVIVRVNGLGTPWGEADLRAAAEAKPDAILVPKIESVVELNTIESKLGPADPGIAVWAMIETPRAILNIAHVASAGGRLQCFVMGTNDLIKEIRGVHTQDRMNLSAALSLSVLAARANGLVVIDGVYNDIANADGFKATCEQARAFGFDGKTLIHPTQVEPCNAVFAPSAAEVEDARKLIAAFELPENKGKGAIKVDGRMVELLHAEIARRTVAVADAIAGLEAA